MYRQSASICRYELICELLICIKLILNSYLNELKWLFFSCLIYGSFFLQIYISLIQNPFVVYFKYVFCIKLIFYFEKWEFNSKFKLWIINNLINVLNGIGTICTLLHDASRAMSLFETTIIKIVLFSCSVRSVIFHGYCII